jgi:DNA mismatch repair protein MutH
LKPSFTYALYRDSLDSRWNNRNLAELANLDRLLRRFAPFVGRSINDVGADIGVRPSTGKGYAASVVHAAVQMASPIPKRELASTGPTTRMSRVDDELLPYEALSFPAFRHNEIITEDWQDSALLALIEHMLIVPVYGRTRQTPQGACVLQTPVYWRPTADELGEIEREWTMFRDAIASSKADRLPAESDTVAIHIRPHARDSTDRDATPGGGSQTKRSFWLNKRFVQRILRAASR